MLHRAVVRLKCEHVRLPGAVQMLAVILMNGISLLKYLSHPQCLPQNKGLKQTYQGFPGGAIVKNQSANARDKRQGFNPRVEKSAWRRKCQPTPVFLPGESQGQRNLAGYTVHGVAESDTTERVSRPAQTYQIRDEQKIFSCNVGRNCS